MFSRIVIPPSFYILCSWTVTLIIYIAEPIILNPLSVTSIGVIIYVIFIAIFSSLFFSGHYSKAIKSAIQLPIGTNAVMSFMIFTALGAVGLYYFFTFASTTIGGFGVYIAILLSNPLEIRGIAVDELGGIVQLTYFSWISIGLGVSIICSPRIGLFTKIVIATIVALEFFANLLFIDRTRPVWLLVIIAITIAMSKQNPRKALRKFVIGIPIAILIMFVSFSIATGKLSAGGAQETLSQYLLGGFSYMNFIFTNITEFDYSPIRTFYPISKVLESLGVITQVPSQILEFYDVPFTTNIGTFIEPLYSDGGVIFLIFGIPFVIITIDWIGIAALNAKSYYGIFIYSNLVLSNMLSFFVAKFTSTPIYLFIAIFIISEIVKSLRVAKRSH